MTPDALLRVLQRAQECCRRHRPLARCSRQLLSDVAALLCGLRAVAMLDYAPGATPQQCLEGLLQPVRAELPQHALCVLQLEGCCYVADTRRLLQLLHDLATDPSGWPALIRFDGAGQPQQAPPASLAPLRAQMQRLHAHVAAAGAGSMVVCLDELQQALPAMPTLNGLLLGYPLVYHVRDRRDAAAASSALSSSPLVLWHIVGRCQVLQQLPGADADGADVVLQAFTAPEACVVRDRVAAHAAALAARAQQQGAGCCWRGIHAVSSAYAAGSLAVRL